MADADEMDVHEIALLNMSGEKFGIGAKCDRRGSNHVCRMKNRRALMVKPRNEMKVMRLKVWLKYRSIRKHEYWNRLNLESTEPRID